LASEYRDDQTGEHTRRVGLISAKIAAALGKPDSYVESISTAATLHDLGKIGIPDRILLKPGRLDDTEWAVMQDHTRIGAAILEGCDAPGMRMAWEIALSHHERWDGAGYPMQLSEEEIPSAGRIVAVADAFDAMTSQRPYKNALCPEEASAELARCSGRQFDPSVVKAFLKVQESGCDLSGGAELPGEAEQLAFSY
jgi:putative two-component system response regulator